MVNQVRDWMTFKPVAVREEGSALEALDQMVEQGIRHLPVVEEGRLYGMISAGDILASEVQDQQATIEYMEEYLYRHR